MVRSSVSRRSRSRPRRSLLISWKYGFEPGGGKGPVARATLYFLLRYPGFIGDGQRELTPDRFELLLAWHEEDPVNVYERHRNSVIAELQGNRNPIIDHSDWARRIDFAAAWA